MFCSKCTCDFNVDRIGPLLTYDSHARTHARTRGVGGQGSRQGGWQADMQEKYVRCIQSFVLFKVFYTSPPSTPVHSNSISTSLGSTQPCYSYCTKTIRTYIHRPYNQVFFGTNEWVAVTLGETNCQSFETAARWLKLGFSRLRAWRSIRNATTPHSMGEKETREGVGQRRSEIEKGGIAGGRQSVCF